MNNNYKEKYLKYKIKYHTLRDTLHKNRQVGGLSIETMTAQNFFKSKNDLISEIETIISSEKYLNTLEINEDILNEDFINKFIIYLCWYFTDNDVLKATAYFESTYSAKLSSNFLISGP